MEMRKSPMLFVGALVLAFVRSTSPALAVHLAELRATIVARAAVLKP